MHTPRRHTRRLLLPVSTLSALALVVGALPASAEPGSAEPPTATEGAAAAATHAIAEVQGTGAASPLVGQEVTVEGVVTADHRDSGYRGVYVQTAGSGGDEDATPGASDGVFVFLRDGTTDAAVGDAVSVTGTVSEYFGLTQIGTSAVGATVAVVEGDTTPPLPTALPATLLGTDREQLEGMLVAPAGDYRVTSTHQLLNFGTVWLAAGDTLPVKATDVLRPGPEAQALTAQNLARRILLDDGRNVTLSDPAVQPYATPDAPVRNGAAVAWPDAPYVLGYGFDDWRLHPTLPIDASTPAAQKPAFTGAERPAAPDAVGGDLQVGAFNVLNYFTTLTSDDPDARGAATAAQLAVQRSKIVAAITGLGADVVALQEIENSTQFGDGAPDVALADLVAGLNDAAGAEEWAFVPTPKALVGPDAPATDVIQNAIIYRPAAATPVGDSATHVDETVWDNAREPIAQTFAPTAGGVPFTVIANHFKSKSGSGTQPADGQGFFNADRVAQAQAVVAFADELRATSGSDDVVVLGDLNSYGQEDPVRVFADAGWVDLVATLAPGESTYTFDGEVGSLDHALATPSFADRVTGADVWAVNAPEWLGLEYTRPWADPSSVVRSSDHDPVLLGLDAGDGPATGTATIDLLTFNDFHGRLEPGGGTSPVAGAAVLAGAVAAFRAQNPATLVASAGDSIGASTFTSFVQQDTPTLDLLDLIGLDASAIGNHELDQGRADLDDRVIPTTDFPWLAANLYDRDTGLPAFDEYALSEVDGVTVGFIGAMTEDLPTLVTPAGIASLEVRPVVAEVNRVAAGLTDGDPANGEADVIVLLVHEGAAGTDLADVTDDSAFGRIATQVGAEVDAIVGGHTHQRYLHRLPVEGWAEGLTRPVIQSSQYGEALGHLTFTVDRATGEVTAIDAENVDLAPAGVAAFPADPEATALVAEAVAAADELGSRSLGTIAGDFNRARDTPTAANAAGPENRGGESTLGNLVADVQLWSTRELGAQIAFMNPGGLRADLRYASSGAGDPDGNVTYREAATVQPFANTLVTTQLTGAQVRQVLEEQWQPAGSSRPFLKLGVSAGLRYVYDPTAPAGQHVTQVTLDGVPLDPAAAYTVVVNSFLASGGDNFATLAQGTGARDSGRVDLQAFVDYLAASSPVGPDLAQRAVGARVTSAPSGGAYAPGDTVTAELSSLLFSGGETQAQTVEVAVGGEPAGTFPIDPARVDGTDEVGRASISVVVPAAAGAGPLDITATVPGTGTSVTFTVQVEAAPAPRCTVDYWKAGVWPGGFIALVTLTNDSDVTLDGWELGWAFTKGERVYDAWNGRLTQNGASVTVRNEHWNGAVRPGRSVSFGFLASAPRTGPGTPSGFTLGGVPCTVS